MKFSKTSTEHMYKVRYNSSSSERSLMEAAKLYLGIEIKRPTEADKAAIAYEIALLMIARESKRMF